MFARVLYGYLVNQDKKTSPPLDSAPPSLNTFVSRWIFVGFAHSSGGRGAGRLKRCILRLQCFMKLIAMNVILQREVVLRHHWADHYHLAQPAAWVHVDCEPSGSIDIKRSWSYFKHEVPTPKLHHPVKHREGRLTALTATG